MNDEYRGFKGIWIPDYIWLNPKLTLIEKLFVAEINSLSSPTKGIYCTRKNEKFAEFFNMSERRVRGIISELMKRKYIKQISFNGRKRELDVDRDTLGREEKNFRSARKKISGLYIERENLIENPSFNKLKEERSPQDSVTSEDVSNFRETNKFLLYWKKLSDQFPGAKLTIQSPWVKHNGGYAENKSYREAKKNLRRLEKGLFHEFKFNKEFLKRNHIKMELLEKKWTEREIMLTLKRLALLRIPGMYPYPDKNKIPRDLKGLIYNSVKGTSFFFATAMHPPYIKSEGKTNEQLDNEIAYKTKGTITSEELQTELDKIDAMWEKANSKFRKRGKPRNEEW